jgi:SpoVK/Ycf46/Vps4 family AAA+-type ATPase
MESFDGIVVLTSNSRQRIDHAFLRRLDVVVEFGVPGPHERRRLWERHLGVGAESGFIERMAGAIDLPGGSVAGAALAARALALAGDRPLTAEDVLVALRAEYQKLGRSVPAELLADSDKRRS